MPTAFLFPGQGSQAPGMGKSLYDERPEARRVFEEADDALGFALSRLCFEGPDEELKQTANTQPALVTVSTACYRVLAAEGFAPDSVAGHSLGEYSALVAAGSLTFADALRLVRRRGQLMQEAVPAGVGAMAALLKLPSGLLDGILEQAAQGEVVTAANLNSPDQIVIAGHAGAVERAMELAKQAGAKRAVLLPVSAPFHCPLMRPAQEKMEPELAATAFQDLSIPLVNNVAAELVQTGEAARHGLLEQIPNAVHWSASMERLLALGVDRFVEVGPGSVLTGLLRNIRPEAVCVKFGEMGDWDKLRTIFASGPVKDTIEA